MKIPKSLKLPRKLKKEIKKGFTRNVIEGYPVLSNTSDGVSCSIYQTVNYSGSNTKAFRRLLNYIIRLQKIQLNRMADLSVRLDLLEDIESVKIFKSEFDEFKKINAMSNLIDMCERYQHVNPVPIVNPENIL